MNLSGYLYTIIFSSHSWYSNNVMLSGYVFFRAEVKSLAGINFGVLLNLTLTSYFTNKT